MFLLSKLSYVSYHDNILSFDRFFISKQMPGYNTKIFMLLFNP